MSLAVTLHTTGPLPTVDALERWLTEQGEPYTRDGDRLRLRALPVELEPTAEFALAARLSVTVQTPLVRTVDLLFDLSVVAGSDVSLGHATLTRAELWLHLAEEQDRQYIAQALAQASERGTLDEVMRRLWAILSALRPGRDVRWSAEQVSIVEVSDDGEQTRPVPPGAHLHLLVRRWLTEAYPSLLET